MKLTKKYGNFCEIQHFKVITKIMINNIIPEHIRSLGISYTFCNTYIKYFQGPFSKDPLGYLKVILRPKRLHVESDFGKLSKRQKI